ncbi:MAG: PhoH family protein [Magnetococcales bacterium]|nr:PhoH family protein [Magnetococcales bacterium]
MRTETTWVQFPDNQLAMQLFGEEDAHLLLIETRLGVTIHHRGNAIAVSSSNGDAKRVHELLNHLYRRLEQGETIETHDIDDFLAAQEQENGVASLTDESLVIQTPRWLLRPRTSMQATMIQALDDAELLIAEGPAGTGKTFLAVAAAVAALTSGAVKRVVLTRPAVEAGERLGFLPGDMQAKVDPYLRPLFDALNDMVGFEKVDSMIGRGDIEVAPLAFMRGRTLRNAYVILDEAQNTTSEQMKMFLTRLGEGSQAVVTGDVSQIDLPHGKRSGLVEALKILNGVKGIIAVRFADHDVVRRPLVQRIVRAYDAHTRHEA